MLREDSEIEFSKWLDNCIRDAREKLGLSWLEICVQLLGKSQKAVLLEINKTQT